MIKIIIIVCCRCKETNEASYPGPSKPLGPSFAFCFLSNSGWIRVGVASMNRAFRAFVAVQWPVGQVSGQIAGGRPTRTVLVAFRFRPIKRNKQSAKQISVGELLCDNWHWKANRWDSITLTFSHLGLVHFIRRHGKIRLTAA